MFEAKDILFIILAFSALWITVFTCWFIYQMAMVIKNINSLLNQLTFQFDRLDQTLNGMKSKFHEGSRHLGDMAENVKDHVKNYAKPFRK